MNIIKLGKFFKKWKSQIAGNSFLIFHIDNKEAFPWSMKIQKLSGNNKNKKLDLDQSKEKPIRKY